MADQQTWDERYKDKSAASPPLPALVLTQNAHLLPAEGTALDLACGLGANAIFLARHGLHVTAWDYSGVAIAQLDRYATQHQLKLQAAVRDVIVEPPAQQSFDVIVVSRFLERGIIPRLCAALKPRGLIFYQTFIAEKSIAEKSPAVGPTNPDYLLKPNELLMLFASLRVRVYREEGTVGDLSRGFRNEAMLVAQHI
jgi:2-polyprenyl-3-methyl-5-hydroxy-6-metoxy-1,4-benzoquinol methylase